MLLWHTSWRSTATNSTCSRHGNSGREPPISRIRFSVRSASAMRPAHSVDRIKTPAVNCTARVCQIWTHANSLTPCGDVPWAALHIISKIGVLYHQLERSKQDKLLREVSERIVVDAEGTVLRIGLKPAFAYLRGPTCRVQ
jgi:hypothetical protein